METKTIKIEAKSRVKELLKLELDFKPRVNGSIIKLYGADLVKTVVAALKKENIETEVSLLNKDKYQVRVVNALLSIKDNTLIFSDFTKDYNNPTIIE